jgi:hypothetical protein
MNGTARINKVHRAHGAQHDPVDKLSQQILDPHSAAAYRAWSISVIRGSASCQASPPRGTGGSE